MVPAASASPVAPPASAPLTSMEPHSRSSSLSTQLPPPPASAPVSRSKMGPPKKKRKLKIPSELFKLDQQSLSKKNQEVEEIRASSRPTSAGPTIPVRLRATEAHASSSAQLPADGGHQSPNVEMEDSVGPTAACYLAFLMIDR